MSGNLHHCHLPPAAMDRQGSSSNTIASSSTNWGRSIEPYTCTKPHMHCQLMLGAQAGKELAARQAAHLGCRKVRYCFCWLKGQTHCLASGQLLLQPSFLLMILLLPSSAMHGRGLCNCTTSCGSCTNLSDNGRLHSTALPSRYALHKHSASAATPSCQHCTAARCKTLCAQAHTTAAWQQLPWGERVSVCGLQVLSPTTWFCNHAWHSTINTSKTVCLSDRPSLLSCPPVSLTCSTLHDVACSATKMWQWTQDINTCRQH